MIDTFAAVPALLMDGINADTARVPVRAGRFAGVAHAASLGEVRPTRRDSPHFCVGCAGARPTGSPNLCAYININLGNRKLQKHLLTK